PNRSAGSGWASVMGGGWLPVGASDTGTGEPFAGSVTWRIRCRGGCCWCPICCSRVTAVGYGCRWVSRCPHGDKLGCCLLQTLLSETSSLGQTVGDHLKPFLQGSEVHFFSGLSVKGQRVRIGCFLLNLQRHHSPHQPESFGMHAVSQRAHLLHAFLCLSLYQLFHRHLHLVMSMLGPISDVLPPRPAGTTVQCSALPVPRVHIRQFAKHGAHGVLADSEPARDGPQGFPLRQPPRPSVRHCGQVLPCSVALLLGVHLQRTL